MSVLNEENSNTYAAIDLGSNSFHLAIGQMTQGELRWQFRISEKVQLASGVNDDNMLDEDTQQRAMDCLTRFHKRIAYIDPSNIRIVGTNALRVIRNSETMLKNIEKIFKQRVDVVSGREEARLIYLGVSHTIPSDLSSKLVIDIGGGSTEFIIGQSFQPILTESLHMGCVTYKKNYFGDNKLSKSNFKNAISASEQEVQHISHIYRKQGWSKALGASGSVKSIFNALKGLNREREVITLQNLDWLIQYLTQFNSIDDLSIPNLKPERNPIFPSGLCILYGAMKQLKIEYLHYSEGALREGLVYDLLGRFQPENVRLRTITALQERFSIDVKHAQRVQKTCSSLYLQAKQIWNCIDEPHLKELLYNAATLHEIGLAISHAQFHKHGAYILTHADLSGFSKQDQIILGALVRLHRRKFSLESQDDVSKSAQQFLKYLAIILRLSVLLHHSRSQTPSSISRHLLIDTSRSNDKKLVISINELWLAKNPLILEDLLQETKLLKKIDIDLKIEQFTT